MAYAPLGERTASLVPFDIADFSESFRSFLIKGILFFTWLSLAAVVLITLHKIVLEWRNKRFETDKERYRQEITQLLFDPDFNRLGPLGKPLEYRASSDVVIELMEAFDDPDYLRILHRYLDEKSVRNYYLKTVFKPQSTSIQRIDAVERLAMFRHPRNRPFFIRLLSNPKNSNDIRISALIGLSYLYLPKDREVFLSTLEQIDSSGKFSEFIFYNIIQKLLAAGLNEEIESVFAWLVKHQDYLSLKAFVEAVSDSGYVQIVPQLKSLYLSTERDDVKISILRALGTLKATEDGCELFFEALQAPNMVMRIVAARSIGVCRCEAAAQAASSALYDKSYLVRQNVARSLLRIPDGVDILKSTACDLTDKYASQSAAYALRLMETSHA